MAQRARTTSSITASPLWQLRRFRNAGPLSLVILGPVLVLATFLVLGPLDRSSSPLTLRLVFLADLIYVLAVAALVARRIAAMIAARRARSAGSRLHLRLTGVFALIAFIPTVMVAIFAGLTINVGLESWFSDRVSGVVRASLSAAVAYQENQRRDLAEDAIDAIERAQLPAGGGIPKPRGVVPRPGDESAPVGAERDAGDTGDMPLQHLKRPTGGGIPQPGGAVMRPGGEHAPVGAERDAGDTGDMPLQHPQLPAGGDIPQSRGVVMRPGGEDAPVGAERDAVDQVGMPELQVQTPVPGTRLVDARPRTCNCRRRNRQHGNATP